MFQRIVILPDIHTPNNHELAIEPIFQFIKFYKPHTFIQLGDFCDWDSVSSYNPRSEREIVTIDYESDAANYLLDEFDHLLKNCKRKIMIGGNHEDRYANFRVNHGMEVQSRRLRTFTTWQDEYGLSKRGWESCDYGENFQIGKIIFTHGWFAGNGAAQQMARCFPGRNVIFGHTHRHLVSSCLDGNDLPIESESIGTLSNFNLSYLKGKPPVEWIHAFMYIDMHEDGTFSKHFVHVINGRFIEYGRIFQRPN